MLMNHTDTDLDVFENTAELFSIICQTQEMNLNVGQHKT